ncbi:MAG: alpha/beta hydrolase [Pirellula sp.]
MSQRTSGFCRVILILCFATTMNSICFRYVVVFLFVLVTRCIEPCMAQGPTRNITIWPEAAPGESTTNSGTALPSRPQDQPTITRVENISLPTMDVFLAAKPNGSAVVVLPGGGFKYVVPDLEGSELAAAFNQLGISVFVLRYRTSVDSASPWDRPLQDSQRAIRMLRTQAEQWKLDPKKIGLVGFSAGGQVASIHLTSSSAAYAPIDAIDSASFRPDFGLLIYPWRIYDAATDKLIAPIKVTKETPTCFIVHTHDDASTSLGAVWMYAELKKANVAAELHVYQNGGHGYGVRSRPNSAIGSWQERAIEWLRIRDLGSK